MLSSLLEGTYPDIMQRLLELASQTSLIEPSEAQEAAAASALASAPMAVDVPGCSPPRREGEDEARHAAVSRTLYYLLSELQDKEVRLLVVTAKSCWLKSLERKALHCSLHPR